MQVEGDVGFCMIHLVSTHVVLSRGCIVHGARCRCMGPYCFVGVFVVVVWLRCRSVLCNGFCVVLCVIVCGIFVLSLLALVFPSCVCFCVCWLCCRVFLCNGCFVFLCVCSVARSVVCRC